jgi:1,4-dihydroxy-2-naphthoate octaprenyltransferase
MTAVSKLKTYILATRPQFFTAIIVPILLGAVAAWKVTDKLNGFLLILTLLAAILFHAGMNVINDYYDELNLTDSHNTEPMTPFAGGSRMIQKGLMTLHETLGLAVTLLALGSIVGLYLAYTVGYPLLLLGCFGLFTGFFYSAPPIFLASRGLGELTVGLNFGVLPVLGSYYVQSNTIGLEALLLSLPVALLITAIIYINEFPDIEPDTLAGKRNLVVRFHNKGARLGILILLALAIAAIVIPVLLNYLPAITLISVFGLIPLFIAGIRLIRDSTERTSLFVTIQLVIFSHLLTGALLITSVLLNSY